jgi:glutamine amidotransferase
VNEVVIVDSGGANLASLRHAFERLGARTHVSADGSVIASAERVLLPGVGAAAHAMRRLRDAGLISVLRTLTQPVLGICLGMQLLFDRSEEGDHSPTENKKIDWPVARRATSHEAPPRAPLSAARIYGTRCLGLLPSPVMALQSTPGRPVPHMGWNQLRRVKSDPLLEGISNGEHAYFVHSYAAPVTEHTLASAEYGMAMSAVVRRTNFWGTQFHPERSAAMGARILDNFLRL